MTLMHLTVPGDEESDPEPVEPFADIFGDDPPEVGWWNDDGGLWKFVAAVTGAEHPVPGAFAVDFSASGDLALVVLDEGTGCRTCQSDIRSYPPVNPGADEVEHLSAAHGQCEQGSSVLVRYRDSGGEVLVLALHYGTVEPALGWPIGDVAQGFSAREVTQVQALGAVQRWARAVRSVLANLPHLQDEPVPVDDGDARWALAGWTVQDRQAAARAGLSEQDAVLWGQSLVFVAPQSTIAQVAGWVHAGIGVDDAVAWIEAGVPGANAVPPGLTPAEAWVALTAGATGVPGAQWSGHGRARVCPNVARAGLAQGHAVEDVVAVAQALLTDDEDWLDPCEEHGAGELDRACGWAAGNTERALEMISGWAEVDWSRLRWCLRAGMDPGAAEKFARGDGDIEPVRLLAALSGDEPGR